MLRGRVEMAGLRTACDAELDRIQHAVTESVREATEGLKREYRDQTFKALGQAIAYAWRSEVYPRSSASLEAAGYVHSNAPAVIDFFSAARVHTPIGGAFAIPTGNVPRKRGGKRMTPFEVERYFNADLEPIRLKNGGLGLAIDLIRGLNVQRPGFRRPTEGRLKQGRRAEPVLMFVLRRSLTSRKLIDIEGPAQRWAARVPGFIEKRLGTG